MLTIRDAFMSGAFVILTDFQAACYDKSLTEEVLLGHLQKQYVELVQYFAELIDQKTQSMAADMEAPRKFKFGDKVTSAVRTKDTPAFGRVKTIGVGFTSQIYEIEYVLDSGSSWTVWLKEDQLLPYSNPENN